MVSRTSAGSPLGIQKWGKGKNSLQRFSYSHLVQLINRLDVLGSHFQSILLLNSWGSRIPKLLAFSARILKNLSLEHSWLNDRNTWSRRKKKRSVSQSGSARSPSSTNSKQTHLHSERAVEAFHSVLRSAVSNTSIYSKESQDGRDNCFCSQYFSLVKWFHLPTILPFAFLIRGRNVFVT